MRRALVFGCVVGCLASGAATVAVAGTAASDQWFRMSGGWAYCAYQPYARALCFSTVTGRWVKVRRIRRAGRVRDVLSTGIDRRYVGFRRGDAAEVADRLKSTISRNGSYSVNTL